MIRLPASRIVLSTGDLKDFDRRQRRRRMIESRVQRVHPDDHMEVDLARDEDLAFQDLALRNQDHFEIPNLPAERTNFGLRNRLAQEAEFGDGCLQEAIQDLSLYDAHSVITNLPEQEHGYVSIGLEVLSKSPTFGSRRLSSPSKHDFQYGGFVESPVSVPSEPGPPFIPSTPNDFSTLANLSATEPRRHHASRLPRSPLFISQNLSNSPERRQTAGLTPRVASRVATHNTPGIIFSQPARRPPRHSATNFRHQTNSFSFDSSERASAAYEQRASSSSTTESFPRPPDDLNLHEELLGSSLQESSSDSESSSSTGTPALENFSPRRLDELDQAIHSQGEFIFSSPHLPLPPPFSAGSRNSSGAGVLPSNASPTLYHPLTSPIRSSSSTPLEGWSRREHDEPADTVFLGPQAREASSSNGGSPRSLFQRANRIFSAYRSRTPSNHGSPNHPPLSPDFQSSWSFGGPDTRTPSSNYQVYDDSRPTYSQPQTPAQLPEARHQSRYHSSMTVPVVRSHSISSYRSARPNEYHQLNQRQLSFATPSRRGADRTNSPAGLRVRGFEGLYGGRENGDEEQNWAEGVRFNSVGVRLWGLRDARNDGRSMRETPEPEEWRVGRGSRGPE